MNKKFIKRNVLITGMLSLMLGAITSCDKAEYNYNETKVDKPNVVFVGLTSAVTSATTTTIPSTIIRYNANNTNQIVTTPYIVPGLAQGESIIAIDYRPSNKVLYALSSNSRIFTLTFTVNATSGAFTGLTSSLVTTLVPALSGSVAAFDWNPVADRLRIITTTGQNLRFNPADNTVIVDGAINGGTNAIITGSAYTNSTNPAPATTELYDIDVAAQKLYKQEANSGTLTEVGSLGLNPLILTQPTYSTGYNTNITNLRIGAVGGFDISASGVALAVFLNGAAPQIPIGGLGTNNPSSAVSAVTGTPTLYQINLATGRATDLGTLTIPAASNYGANSNLIGLAIVP